MMNGHQLILHIHTQTQLEGRSHQNPHPTGTNLRKQCLPPLFRIRIMDIGDLLRWDAGTLQQGTNFIIDIEALFRGGAVAEDQLRAVLMSGFLIDVKDILRTPGNLGLISKC